jgi:hypothetical protein
MTFLIRPPRPPKVYVCLDCGFTHNNFQRFRRVDKGWRCMDCQRKKKGRCKKPYDTLLGACSTCGCELRIPTNLRNQHSGLCADCRYEKKILRQREYQREKYRREHNLSPADYWENSRRGRPLIKG